MKTEMEISKETISESDLQVNYIKNLAKDRKFEVLCKIKDFKWEYRYENISDKRKSQIERSLQEYDNELKILESILNGN